MSGADWQADCKRVPLSDVAAALGLPARGDRFTCPGCGAEPKSRRCRWWPRAAPKNWRCEGCGGGGTGLDLASWRILGRSIGPTDWAPVRVWFASFGWCEGAPGGGSVPRLRPLPAPPRVDAARGPALDLVAAWKALAPLHDAAAAAAWWMRRGVDEASAHELARVPDLLYLPPDRPRTLGPDARGVWALTAARTGDPRRPLLYLVRDAHGAHRGAQRRAADRPPPGVAKSKALPSEALPGALEGRAHLLGNIPAAAEHLARGGRVALVEGEIDHAVATAAGWVAVGATGAEGLPRAAAAVVEALQGAAVATMGRVHLVPHAGDKPTPRFPDGAGGPCMALAGEVLSGAGVPLAVVTLPLRPDGRADLADVAEGKAGPRLSDPTVGSLEAVRVVLESGAPVAGPAVARDVVDARSRVIEATIRKAIERATPGNLPTLSIPPGGGKTWAAVVAVLAVARGLRVAYVTRTHELARQAKARAEAAGAAPGTLRHVRGLAARDDGKPLCRAYREHEQRGRGPEFREALQSEGRAVCGKCPFMAGCPVAGRAEARPGEVHFMPIQAVRHLAPDTFDLLILDDCGRDIETTKATPEHLAKLYPGTKAGERLEALAPVAKAVGDALAGEHLAHLARVAEAEALALSGRRSPRRPCDSIGHRLTGAALAVALEPARAVVEAWAASCADPQMPLFEAAPPVVAADTTGHFYGLESVAPRVAVEAVKLAVLALLGLPSPDGAVLAVELQADGWAFETIRPAALPVGARVVALDGTAERAPMGWAFTAAANGRTLEPMAVRILSGRSVPYHWRTGAGLNISRLGTRDERGRFVFADTAPAALRAALADVLEAVALRGRIDLPTVAIVTLKVVALAFRSGLGLDLSEDERREVKWNKAAREVGAVAADLASWCQSVEVGHYGADDRGTNRFDSVNILALLGCPRAPREALEAQASAMGAHGVEATAEGLSLERIGDTLAQSVARARHLSNPDLLGIYGAADSPPPTGPDLPGLEPVVTKASSGDCHAWARAERRAALAALANTVGELRAVDGSPEDVAAVGRSLEWEVRREPCSAGFGPRVWVPPLDIPSNDSGHLAGVWAESGREIVLHVPGLALPVEALPGEAVRCLEVAGEAAPPCSIEGLTPNLSQVLEIIERNVQPTSPVDPLPAKRLSQTTPLAAAVRLALAPVLAAFREVDNARPPDQPLRGPGAGEAPPKPPATMATTWPPAGLPPKPAG